MDMSKLVILVDPGVVNYNDLMGLGEQFKDATILRFRKAVWGMTPNYPIGPLTLVLGVISSKYQKDEILEALKPLLEEHVDGSPTNS